MANKVQRIGFIGISGRGSGMLDLLLQVDGVVVPNFKSSTYKYTIKKYKAENEDKLKDSVFLL